MIKSLIRDIAFIYIGYELLMNTSLPRYKIMIYAFLIIGFTLFFRIGKIKG